MGRVLILEPFYGGSHKQLVDVICALLPPTQFDLYTMSSKKWHWRARTSSLYFSQQVPAQKEGDYDVIFCSCVLSLAELLGLRPDLTACRKIVYFHENQLTYPVQKIKERDFQFGYNQVTTALAADTVLFNSNYNMESFLSNIGKLFKIQPDNRPNVDDLGRRIRAKSRVLYFPVKFPGPLVQNINKNARHAEICPGDKSDNTVQELVNTEMSEKKDEVAALSVNIEVPLEVGIQKDDSVLHILWPHRWEHDKNPDMFFRCLLRMKDEGIPFQVSVLGETYSDVPEIFHSARQSLSQHITNFGFVETKEKYFEILEDCDVVVSTADHEFFGVAMLEAVFCSCYPLAPNKLVYPEIFPTQCLYNTEQQLFKRLKNFAKNPSAVKKCLPTMQFEKYSADRLDKEYLKLFVQNL